MVVDVRGMKTWSGLAKNRRRPSEYEIVTTNLQTRNRHPDQAYELSPAPLLAMNEWYKRNVFDSPLQHDNWEDFRDPDELIYRVYTRTQDGQEEYIDGLLDEHNEIGYDKELLVPEWLDVLGTPLYAPPLSSDGAADACRLSPANRARQHDYGLCRVSGR